MNLPELKVLLVDDDEIVRMVITAFLEDEGFYPLEAASGRDALAILETEDVVVAVVDVNMPGMDGHDFIRRAHRLRPGLRFVIHSGSGVYDLPEDLSRLGLTQEHVFKKPIRDLAAFSAALASLAGMRK